MYIYDLVDQSIHSYFMGIGGMVGKNGLHI